MLHRFLFILIMFSHRPLSAIEPTETQKIDLISMDARETLRKRLEHSVVSIERRAKLRAGLYIPGRDSLRHAGWLISPGFVITASAGLLRHGHEESVEFWIRHRGTQWKATLLAYDVRQGVAVFHDGSSSLSQAFPEVPKSQDFWQGRPVFVHVAKGVPIRSTMTLPAPGPLEFYWRMAGQFPIGTPVTDATGRLISLVGLSSSVEPSVALLLPPAAVTWAFEKVGTLGKR